MLQNLFKNYVFSLNIAAFFAITAASESAMTAGSFISLKDRCAAVLIEHPEYLDPESYAWKEARISKYDRENRSRMLDELRSLWCLQKAEAVPQMRLKGDGWQIESIAFNHNGTQLASGSFAGAIRLWNPTGGACEHVLKGHAAAVVSVGYNHDGTQFASGSSDGVMRTWNPIDGSRLRNSKICEIVAIAYNHDGTQLAAGSLDGVLRVWDPVAGTSLYALKGHIANVRSIAYNHNGTQLASGSWDEPIGLWDPINGTKLRALEGQTGGIKSVAFNHNGTQLASGSTNRTIRIWNPINGACLHILERHEHEVNSVAYNHDGTQLASGSADRTIRVWNPIDGFCLRMFGMYAGPVTSVAYNHEGTQLAWSAGGLLYVLLILEKNHLASLSHKERLGLFRALLNNKKNKYCADIEAKLSGLKMIEPFKEEITSWSFCHIQ